MTNYLLRYKRENEDKKMSYHFKATDKAQADFLAREWLQWQNNFNENFVFVAVYED